MAFGPQNYEFSDGGPVTAYYNNGPGTNCKKQIMDSMDYKAAIGPNAPAAEAAKWALSPQGTVTDSSVTRNQVGTASAANGFYCGVYGNE